MLEKSTLNGTDEVLKAQPNAIENFVVSDLPGFADFADQLPAEKQRVGKAGTQWWGGMTYRQSVTALRYGDMAGVAASDKLLAEMETLVPVSQSWRTHNSVVGMCPNVQQYLAGNPYNMRLKRRCATTTAPLSIFVELVASAGIDARTCLKRGAAMLALVRMLANLRPVELWCVIAIGQRNSRSSLCVRLDTLPLDLARSAHVFTHPSVFRAATRMLFAFMDDPCSNEDAIIRRLRDGRRRAGRSWRLRRERLLMCTYEPAGAVYSLDNGAPAAGGGGVCRDGGIILSTPIGIEWD